MDDVVLCADELVTNAILHARTDVEIVVRRVGAGVRVDVKDHDRFFVPAMASAAEKAADDPYDWAQLLGLEAMTGRGLVVVDALADRWGSEAEADGKRVWFELGTGGEEQGPLGSSKDDQPAKTPPGELEAVVLQDLPLSLALYSDEHLDDLVREFQLISLGAPTTQATAELAELIEKILAFYAAPRHSARNRARELVAAGHQRGDITMLLPPEAATDIQRLHALVLEADRFCRQGQLLSLTVSAQVMSLREWIVFQVVHQLEGAQPTPCPIEE